MTERRITKTVSERWFEQHSWATEKCPNPECDAYLSLIVSTLTATTCPKCGDSLIVEYAIAS